VPAASGPADHTTRILATDLDFARAIRPARIVCAHLPDRFRKAANPLRALVFLTNLHLIQRETEFVPNRERAARQPNERVDKPNRLARLFQPFGRSERLFPRPEGLRPVTFAAGMHPNIQIWKSRFSTQAE
jgi:hypothetical protein